MNWPNLPPNHPEYNPRTRDLITGLPLAHYKKRLPALLQEAWLLFSTY